MDLTPRSRKARAALAMMAMSPDGSVSREKLAGVLWGGKPDFKARANLRQCLRELRQSLNTSTSRLEVDTKRITLRLDKTSIDIREIVTFGEHVQDAPEDIAELYGGRLLDDDLPDEGTFDDWLYAERIGWENRIRAALVAILRFQVEENKWSACERTAAALLRIDPAHEEAHRSLMQIYAARSDLASAARQYRILKDALSREYGAAPSSKTADIYAEIRAAQSERASTTLAPRVERGPVMPHPIKEPGEEGFEDWLGLGRSKVELQPAQQRQVQSSWVPQNSVAPQPQLLILPINVCRNEDQLLGNSIMDAIIQTVLIQECLDIIDLRDGLKAQIHPRSCIPSLGLVLRLLPTGDDLNLSVILKRMDNGKIVWSGWYADSTTQGSVSSLRRFRIFSSQLANTIGDRLSETTRSESSGSLFGAIHNVLSHSKAGQSDARRHLAEKAQDSGVARAWLMYTYAVTHAERYGGLAADALEELHEHCILANNSNPDNPIVQAIIGHIYAFVFRNPEKAEYHHQTARKIGWSHPIVWTLSAMHENYACRPDKAYGFSKRALRLSVHSPYKFFFQGPHSVSSSLSGRHYEAVDLSKRVLEKKPVFLAAMRHMVASQIMIGEVDGARATVKRIRERDPRFLIGELACADYPLPSTTSVELIKHALKQVGMG